MALQDMATTKETPVWNLQDTAEFEAGLAKLMPFLRAFARSLSGKRELAEDLAQMALTKAWQSRHSFLPGSNLKAWLFTILRNEYYSYQRSAWRQIPWDAMLADTMPAPFDEQEWVVELRDAARAMLTLPASQREALILVGVGGFSYKEAAELSKSAIGTVKSRVGRARHALKESLDSPKPPIKSPVRGTAMNEMFVQLSHLTRSDAPRAPARMAIA